MLAKASLRRTKRSMLAKMTRLNIAMHASWRFIGEIVFHHKVIIAPRPDNQPICSYVEMMPLTHYAVVLIVISA